MPATPPLAPKAVTALAQCGIRSLNDLQAADPCRAFLLLKDSGLTVTRSVFWQLVGLCCGKTPPQLSAEECRYWQERLDNYPPVRRFPHLKTMQHYMQAALTQAQAAAAIGEIPVGAVVVCQDQIIAAAHNRCITDRDISRHAEIRALAAAGQHLGNYRLDECDLYVTLEPCSMCAGAIIQARVKRLIYAAAEPKTGAAGSVIDLFAKRSLNSHTAVQGGVCADEATRLLQDFFRSKRNNPTLSGSLKG